VHDFVVRISIRADRSDRIPSFSIRRAKRIFAKAASGACRSLLDRASGEEVSVSLSYALRTTDRLTSVLLCRVGNLWGNLPPTGKSTRLFLAGNFCTFDHRQTALEVKETETWKRKHVSQKRVSVSVTSFIYLGTSADLHTLILLVRY